MAKPPPEDIDPKRVDVATSPRRRRVRAKPEPSEALKATKPARLARALKRPAPPSIMFERDGDDGYAIAETHGDRDLFDLHLADTFGTRSAPAMRSFLNHLEALCSKAWDAADQAWRPNEQEMSAALAMIASNKPRDEGEAALCAQMVAANWIAMRLAAQALNRGNMIIEQDAALSGKMMRTYAQLLQALRESQGKRRSTRQTIKVSRENHIHYHDHRGSQENGRQPHATRAGAIGERPALPSQDTSGDVVPLSRIERKAGL